MTTVSSVFVSVVALLRNDEALAATYVKEVLAVLQQRYENYELVLVDDGSRDQTIATLRPLLATFPGIQIIRLSRSFGDQIAFSAGLETAIGDVVVTVLPDTDPADLIPALVERVRSGVGVVYGVDAVRARAPGIGSHLFHWLTRRFFDFEIPRHTTSLSALSRPALNALMGVKDRSRNLRTFMPYIGFKIEPFPYDPRSRAGLKPPRSVFHQIDLAFTIITASTTRPLRVVSWLGLGGGVLNLMYIVYVLAIALFKRHVAEGWTTSSFQHAVMFLFLFLILAVISEYLGRILGETQDRPLYFVADELNSSILVPNHDRRNVVTESA